MRKTVLFSIFFLFYGLSLFAEEYDLIVTIEHTKIQCSIREITDTDVRYVRTDRPQSVIFSTPLSRISVIVYRDGTVETVGEQKNPQRNGEVEDVAESEVATSQVPKTISSSSPVVSQTPHSSAVAYGGSRRICRDRGEYQYAGKYVSRKEVERIIQTDILAAGQWRKARRIVVGGYVMAGISVTADLLSLGLIPVGMEASLPTLGVGLVFSSISIGLLCGGYAGYHKAIDIYNSHVEPVAELHISASPASLGLALRF